MPLNRVTSGNPAIRVSGRLGRVVIVIYHLPKLQPTLISNRKCSPYITADYLITRRFQTFLNIRNTVSPQDERRHMVLQKKYLNH